MYWKFIIINHNAIVKNAQPDYSKKKLWKTEHILFSIESQSLQVFDA